MNRDKVANQPSTIFFLHFKLYYRILNHPSHDRSFNRIDKIFKQIKNKSKIISKHSYNSYKLSEKILSEQIRTTFLI